MGVKEAFSAVAKMGRSVAVLLVPFALSACATSGLPVAQCMEGTRVEGPANIVSVQHYAVNQPCRNTLMNTALVNAGNAQDDAGLVAMGLTAQAMQNPQYEQARGIVANVMATPNGKLICTTRASTPGSTDIPLGDCRLVMVQTQTAPSQSSAPASAPQ